ncbi:IucA/IucC family C-terminal-domain containing protein [Dactylosporangium sp. NPDC050588]|uniref:ferric iron reductase n=1 Tax=Dactylosporangium sp. NPDC050588 TaxID=3157211 RepID=UPI003406F0F5
MQLDSRDPIALWQYAERYLGVGTRTYSPYAGDLDISDVHHPQLGAESFQLPTFQVPSLRTAASGLVESSLPLLYEGLLPVHPDALDAPDLVGRAELLGSPRGPSLTAVPSANARTVFVTAVDGRPVEPHFVKLHYPRRLSRFTRRLRRPIIELQLWVSDHLAAAGTPILPEVAGGWFGTGGDADEHAWGYLLRAARPLAPAPAWTVPLFALYGRDLHHPSDPTLLEQLVVRSGEDPLTYVASRIVAPMVRLWSEVARTTGCPLETHGQNTLFAFDAAGDETRILYRDCAIYVDAAHRARLGLTDPLPPTNVIPRDVPMAADEVFSLTYDSFMGHHALSYVAALASSLWQVPPAALHAVAREAFTAQDLLPPTVFYYDNVLYDNGDWKLVDTGQHPDWR